MILSNVILKLVSIYTIDLTIWYLFFNFYKGRDTIKRKVDQKFKPIYFRNKPPFPLSAVFTY